MRYSSRLLRVLVVIGTVMVCGTLGGASRSIPAHAQHALPQAGCAALGDYPTGPRVAAHAHIVHQGISQPRPSPWRLVGNITLSAFSGCGQPTVGTFSVKGLLMGMSVQSGGVTVTVPCEMSCWGPPLAVISATGTFRQDAAHAADPLYVTVNATVTSAHPGPQDTGTCVESCFLHKGSQFTFTHITGYLRVTPGENVTLSFLPPPRVSLGSVPMAVVIYGWRGM